MHKEQRLEHALEICDIGLLEHAFQICGIVFAKV